MAESTYVHVFIGAAHRTELDVKVVDLPSGPQVTVNDVTFYFDDLETLRSLGRQILKGAEHV